jgi:recombinational DNA repair ATPase RecF
MKIERCEIKRFGKLKNFKAEFAPGLNLVKGPNEAGKTTLVEALGAGLFGDPQDVSREVKEKTSWGSDKKFELVLELEDGGERWQLSKDFEKGQGSWKSWAPTKNGRSSPKWMKFWPSIWGWPKKSFICPLPSSGRGNWQSFPKIPAPGGKSSRRRLPAATSRFWRKGWPKS